MSNRILSSKYLKNSIARQIAEKAIPALKVLILQGVVFSTKDNFNTSTTELQGLGKKIAADINKLPPTEKKSTVKEFQRKIRKDKDVKKFIKSYNINLKNKDLLQNIIQPYFTNILKNRRKEIEEFLEENQNATPSPPTLVNRELKIKLKKVKCYDDTPQISKDEIDMAFVITDDKGNPHKVSPFRVGEFNTGDEKTLNKLIKSFPLDLDYSDNKKFFTVTALMAEIDAGGFGDIVNEVYAEVGAVISGLIVSAAAAIGGEIGAAVGAVGGPIGALIGAIIGVVIAVLIWWLISGLKDDPCDPVVFSIYIPSTESDFNGNLETTRTEHFVRYSTDYSAEFEFELIR